MKKTVKVYRIKIPKKVLGDMAEKYKCSPSSVYQALGFYCNSELALDMRRYAFEHGGILLTEEKPVV